ncbi:MAG: glucoamylase family protein [Elusimicrobiota bacterium]
MPIKLNKQNSIGILFAISLLFSSAWALPGAEPVLKFDFNNPASVDGISSVNTEPGSLVTGKVYESSGENIHEGSGSLLITFRSSGSGSAEWKLALSDIEGIGITRAAVWVKGVLGKENFLIALKDASQNVYTHPVKIHDNLWQKIEVPLDAKTGINSSSVREFSVIFSSLSPPGYLFFDELEFYGIKTKSAKKTDKKSGEVGLSKTDAPAKSATPAVPAAEKDLSSGKLVYKGNPPITQIIRSFKRTEEDLKAVSDMLIEAAKNDPPDSKGMTDEEFMDMVQQRAFLFFWFEANPDNGLTLDRGRCFETTGHVVASNASAGFMLTAVCIAHSRGWITYEQAYERVMNTLKFHRDKTKNVEGFFFHFVDITTGERAWNCELSTVDTSLFLAGVVFTMEYFKGTEIEKIAEDIYLRVNWRWAHNSTVPSTSGGKFCAMGWSPETNWNNGDSWNRYCEGLLLNILELGHPKANIDKSSWYDISKAKGAYKGFECVSQTGPLFGYQYPHCWLDFRDKNDGWGNHFEISVNETLANRQYAIELMDKRKGYGPNSWGFTACDYPNGYNPFAAPPGPPGEDGTIAVTAPGGSFAFTPMLSLKALRYMYDTWRDKIWGKYGFVDSYNIEKNWFCGDNIGIDQGPFVLSIENHRTGLVWKYMMKNRYIQAAFKKIGFKDEPRATAKVLPLDLSGNDWFLNISDRKEFSKRDFDDSLWQKVCVPDKWENQLVKQFDGTGWYRKHFTVTQEMIDSWKGQRITLHIGGIDDRDETYLNGARVGNHSGWDAERIYNIDVKLLNPGEDNVIAVKVIDLSGDGGIWMRPVEIGPHIPYEWKPFRKE